MAGFRRKGSLLSLGVLGGLLLTVLNCATPNQAGGDDDDEDDGENFTVSDDDTEETEEIDMTTLPHPKKATSTATRIFIMTAPLPSATELAPCAGEVKELGASATSEVDLQKAQINLMKEVQVNPPLYHFCFYNLMNDLDLRLERGGPVMTELANDFFVGFRGLLVLARTLDAYAGSSRYFGYLQRRYIQLSRDVFGRQVELMPSFGATQERDRERRSKPAGSVLP